MVRRSFQVTLAATAMALMAQAVGHGHADTDALGVSRLILIESPVVDAHLVDETYRAEITNARERPLSERKGGDRCDNN